MTIIFRRIGIIFLVIFVLQEINVHATNDSINNLSNIEFFLTEIKEYANEYFPELADDNFLQSMLQGKVNLEKESFYNKVVEAFIGEFQNNLALIFKIIGIAIICSVFKNIQMNFSDSSIGEIAFYVCYLLVVSLIVTSFTNTVSMCAHTIEKLSDFMNMVTPLIFALMTVTGSITSISFLQPLILGMIALITVLLNKIILPLIYIATVIHIVTNLSSQIKLDKLANFIQKISLRIMEISLIIFAGILSLEGSLAASVDGLTSKIAKNVVSSSIPVVGKLLGDTVDSVIGGITVTKNAIGFLGIIAILAITIGPLIKSLITMMAFNFSSSIIESLSDVRISKCMSGIAESLKIVVGILTVIIFIFIIAITMMIKISNQTLMYQ